jgi:4-hydroxy-3-polyprenylbenzoate decarboxylase
MHPVVLALTGASGAAYGVRLLQVLLHSGQTVYLTISPSFAAVLRQELGWKLNLAAFDPRVLLQSLEDWQAEQLQAAGWKHLAAPPGASTPATLAAATPIAPRIVDSPLSEAPAALRYCHYEDLMTPIASGSCRTAGMVVCPCSGSTLSAIAHAQGSNLIHRAAEVHLKERRKLILVPRETPLSLPQLENMRAVTLAGAILLPASPGFYHNPRGMLDLVDFVVARICDQLGIEQALMSPWGSKLP